MDPGKAQDVMGQTDVFSNEPMQFRVGGELITKLRFLLPDDLTVNVENRDLLPFFERLLYAVPAEEFLKEIMANVVSEDPRDNEKAKRKFNELLVKAKEDYKKYKGDDDDEDYIGEDEDSLTVEDNGLYILNDETGEMEKYDWNYIDNISSSNNDEEQNSNPATTNNNNEYTGDEFDYHYDKARQYKHN